ncbi:MAG: NACHT domain-containing protein [Paracoccaceae bacterium]|uniref:NACHT domain-containing protein n=2 Tax=Pseudomonadota TaxID=1224 RepID=UPI003297E5DD
MPDYLDERSIATKVTQRAIDRILDTAEDAVRGRIAKSRNKYPNCYNEYLLKKAIFCRKIRNSLFDSTPANIEDIYVPSKLSTHERKYSRSGTLISESYQEYEDEDLHSALIRKSNREGERPYASVFIRGIAGTGKSLFMRHLFLKLFNSTAEFVPIFLELRSLNSVGKCDFEQVIYNDFKESGVPISSEQIRDGLHAGMFILIFDGFDEIKIGLQNHYSIEFEKFASRYQKCPVVVSGRPQHESDVSALYRQFDLMPLEVERAVLLITKLRIDDATRQSFIAQLRQNLFVSYQDFAQNPLLLSIMLLTFAEAGIVSPKRHEFLEDAFNALWARHDASKEAYYRERKSAVSKSEFLSIVSAFSASTYSDEATDFVEREMVEHLRRANDVCGLEVSPSPEDLQYDLTVTTCLIIKEGTKFRFTHRYFQEFFTALYISKLPDGDAVAALDVASRRYETDHVLQLVRSINDEVFERLWLLDRWKSADSEFSIVRSSRDDYLQYAGYFEDGHMNLSGGKFKGPSSIFDINRVVFEFYPKLSNIENAFDRNNSFAEIDLEIEKGVQVFENPLISDFENQKRLRRRLEEKYVKRGERRGKIF